MQTTRWLSNQDFNFMGFLGNAIAAYLTPRQGLYSVQLPDGLRQELLDLVLGVNTSSPWRAVYVTDLSLPSNVHTSKWSEVLKWRTDDRVFAWERGAGEPDSSFKSAVRDFIGPRFPVDGSICDLKTLAELAVRHAFDLRAIPTAGPFYEAFATTVFWIGSAYAALFRHTGSLSASHWTDQFMIEWAIFCDELPTVVDAAVTGGLQPRFAWELVRVAGLIVPTIDRNQFGDSPTAVLPDGPALQKYAETWNAVASEFILRSENRAVLLNELDKIVQGAGTRSPWRDLTWAVLDGSIATANNAISAGRRVFQAAPSLTMITPQPPTYPAAPAAAWWGVTEADLARAIKEVRQERPVQPEVGSQTLLQPFQSADLFLLATRHGAVTFPSTKRKWRCVIQCKDVVLHYRGAWKSLFVDQFEPPAAGDGDTWISPTDIKITVGKGVSVAVNGVTAVGGLLKIECTVNVEHTGSIDPASGLVATSWEPERTLKLSLQLRDYIDGSFGPAREIDSRMALVVPSVTAPTVLVSNSAQTAISPRSDDEFSRDVSASDWLATSTPEIDIVAESDYSIAAYDGTVTVGTGVYRANSPIRVNDLVLQIDSTDLYSGFCRLSDGDTVSTDVAGEQRQLLVFRVPDEQPISVSSGLVAALQGRPASRRPPSVQAASSLLGRHQTTIVRGVSSALGSATFDSLFGTVIPSETGGANWPTAHPATRNPLFVGIQPMSLPGIGTSPDAIFDTGEYGAFSRTLKTICEAIGLSPQSHDLWLSGFDPSSIPSSLVRQYNSAHSALIERASAMSAGEAFWATYPFSIFVVDGRPGKHLGQLQAILLSPLHPVRIAWAHAVAMFARHADVSAAGTAELMGLAEGWNFPMVGYAPSPTGGRINLVAVPIDPGPERDFLQWSALAVLSNGLVDVPAAATGLPLPWAGRSGINDKVVERALDDYLSVSPFVSSLVVDLRSVASAPRSSEIDNSVLEFLSDSGNRSVAELAGGARVWDSSYREGAPPGREQLAAIRENASAEDVPFEWRQYEVPNVPEHSDVAFVENAGVSLGIAPGTTTAHIGPLPLRRLPSTESGPKFMDQNFRCPDDEDVLGLASLLRRIEVPEGEGDSLRASPSLNTLGIGQGGKWEIVGTFNLSPRLLAQTISSDPTAKDRLLWEWRPSWLNPERHLFADLSRRPYYVVARIPASLTVGLARRQLLTTARVSHMIAELGKRAVGLATLYTAGETHESAAAGFYSALQLLIPSSVTVAAGWMRPAPWIHTVVPIDPLVELIAAIAGKKFRRRADLLGIGCIQDDQGTHLCLVPIEVKHHGAPGSPAQKPTASDSELKRAREQLSETYEMLQAISDAVTAVHGNCMIALGRRLGLSVLVDFALDFAATAVPAHARSAIISDILNGRSAVTVGAPSLFWFAPGLIGSTGAAMIHEEYSGGPVKSHEAYIDTHAIQGLLWPGTHVGADDLFVRSKLDEMMTAAISSCSAGLVKADDLRKQIGTLLNIPAEADVRHDAPSKSVPYMPPPPPTTLPANASPAALEGPTEHGGQPTATTTSGPSSASELEAARNAQAPKPRPTLVVGARELGSRWMVLGTMASGSREVVAFDFDQPKVVGVFGYMGSGKSYLLGALTEAAVQHIAGLSETTSPLAVVVFNYRRNASDRFELTSLRHPNADQADVQRLSDEFSAGPAAVRDISILTLRGELTPSRIAEYDGLPAQELQFRPSTLDIEDWELLMGEPGSNKLYSQLVRHALVGLREKGDVSVDALKATVAGFTNASSRAAAAQRLVFAERHLSEATGVNFSEVVQPGRVLIIDLRQPLFNRDDALRFFLVCANQISRVQGRFNKMVIFDEAHEYLSESFGEKLDSRIRLSRHEGTSYVFATQDVGSIPTDVQRFVATKCVFGLGSHQNVKDLLDFAPEFKTLELVQLQPGHCFVQSTTSYRNIFSQPRLVRVRPRASAHGGGTRIFA